MSTYTVRYRRDGNLEMITGLVTIEQTWDMTGNDVTNAITVALTSKENRTIVLFGWSKV